MLVLDTFFKIVTSPIMKNRVFLNFLRQKAPCPPLKLDFCGPNLLLREILDFCGLCQPLPDQKSEKFMNFSIFSKIVALYPAIFGRKTREMRQKSNMFLKSQSGTFDISSFRKLWKTHDFLAFSGWLKNAEIQNFLKTNFGTHLISPVRKLEISNVFQTSFWQTSWISAALCQPFPEPKKRGNHEFLQLSNSTYQMCPKRTFEWLFGFLRPCISSFRSPPKKTRKTRISSTFKLHK